MPQTNQARTSTPAPAPNAEFRAQIRQTIQDAQAAALAASQDAAQAARAARAAGTNVGPVIAVPPVPPLPPTVWTSEPPRYNDSIPPQVVDISIAFFLMCAVIVIGWPLARAFGKRIERRAEVAAVNPAMAEQLQRIEQAVDAMSIEVERISESQRFMARLQNAQTSDRAALPADRS